MFKKINLSQFLVYITLFLFTTCAPKPIQTTGNQAAPVNNQAQNPESSPQAQPLQNTSPYSTDKEVIAKGQQLFQNNCTACHSFKQKGIGPNLAGLTADVPHSWITRFIRNAPEVIQSGDNRARRLLEEYNQYMPPFPQLNEADIQALVSYIHKNKNIPAEEVSTAHLGEVLKDPIPDKIPKAGLNLMLEELLTAPATAQKVPLARINKMRVLSNGKKERHFIQELRGLIYEMENNKLRVFMDITKERPGFIPQPGLATGFGSFAFHPEFYKNGLFYTTHTEKANAAPADFAFADTLKVTLQWVLTEWKMKEPNSATFAGTGREMWRVNMMT
ncbi:MAG: cytochrome, partial [Adhaeribacter sp.]|nr:cytochrome [Adhaeribacter sp.]